MNKTNFWAVMGRGDVLYGVGPTRFEAENEASKYFEVAFDADVFDFETEFRTVPCTEQAFEHISSYGYRKEDIYVHAPNTPDELIDLVRK